MYRALVSCLVLAMLAALVLAEPVEELGANEEKSFSVEVTRDFTLSLDFALYNFTSIKPSFELASGDVKVKVLAGPGPKPRPGVFLYVGGRRVGGREVLPYLGSWFRLELTSTGGRTLARLITLNETWLGIRVEFVPSLYKQGLAYDGKVWYFTATGMIFRLKPDGSVEAYNDFPIPPRLREEGYFHLGDLEYFNGLLLVPIEKKGFVRPAVIALYDAKSLKLIRYAYTPQDHMPWLAVDEEGYVYSSEFSPATEIYVYRLEDVGEGNSIEPVRVVKLSMPLKGVQGGAVYGGKLYLSVIGWKVYEVDLETGVVKELFRVPPMYEMEGIEVCKLEDGSTFHVLVNTFGEENVVYHYARVEPGFSLDLFEVEGEVKLASEVRVKAYTPMKIANVKSMKARVAPRIPPYAFMAAAVAAIAVTAAVALKIVRGRARGSSRR